MVLLRGARHAAGRRPGRMTPHKHKGDARAFPPRQARVMRHGPVAATLAIGRGRPPLSLPMFALPGKVALVTGGSKGLGKAMARGLAQAGADIVISSRHENELKPALEEILRGPDRRGRFIVADMSRRDEATRV